MKRNRTVYAMLLLVVGAIIASRLLTTPSDRDIGGEYTSIEFRYLPNEQVKIQQDERPPVVCTDPAILGRLVALLHKRAATKDHKCSDTGRFELKSKDGQAVQIGTLAGHDPRYYEIRVYRSETGNHYDIYRLNRTEFLAVMADVGVKELDSGGPE
jgi:hypothetical protein